MISLAVLFTVIAIGKISFFRDSDLLGAIGAFVLLIVIFLNGYSLKASNYKIHENNLIVQFPFSKKSIPLTAIESAERIEKDKIKGSLRVFGNGGLFGYYGQFENKILGQMNWYITQKENLVLIQTTNGQKIVLSPNQPNAFVDALMRQ